MSKALTIEMPVITQEQIERSKVIKLDPLTKEVLLTSGDPALEALAASKDPIEAKKAFCQFAFKYFKVIGVK